MKSAKAHEHALGAALRARSPRASIAYERPMMRGIIVVWMFWTSPANSNRVTVGIGGSMPKNDREAAEQRQHAVALGLLPEQLLELRELLRVLGRQVVRLAEVVGQVVELPRVLLGVPVPPGANFFSVAGEKSHGSLSSLAQAHQPSL